MSVATTAKTAESTQSSTVRLALLWQNSVGKKALMALTGIVLFLYVLAHLIGNLQIYAGSDKIDAYARFLHSNPGMLWVARAVLLAAVITHAAAGIILWLEKQRARPIAYTAPGNLQASAASRTMIWSGLAILFFVVYHVANLTLGAGIPGYEEVKPSVNVPAAFRVTWAAIVYIIAMVGLGFHLWHGLYSMWQSLGFRHPRYTPGIRAAAALVATLIALGNISIPVAVLAGLLR
jgi:succinate dehydrogenase / fumarate reductase, cytochrome b subunit